MEIAIDVGYGFTKALSVSSKVLIPSVVSAYRDLVLSDISRNGTGHAVQIRRLDGSVSRHFVGDLALREGHVASFTLEREKHRHPNHDILLLTAARLLGAGSGATLVAGLPIAYYKTQKEDLKKHLESLHAEVSVNGGAFERVSFGKVIIYPQGAGALFTMTGLPENGLVLLVDVGQKTTDYITAEVSGGRVKPVSSLCGSVETGVYAVYEALAQEFQARTGAPLASIRAAEIVSNNGVIYYFGKEMDFSNSLKKIRTEVAQSIADQVQAALGDRFAFLRNVYLAGGGAEALPQLSSMFPFAQSLPDPQWANARGFLAYVQSLKAM
ncbi:MAG: ParM/StbA family protein [Peptococcaceae bacterium]|nr:ParM/StbA family protein [Peptococcaceae bacterium]